MDRPIRIVIVDDHQVVLDGFMARLEIEPEIEVVGNGQQWLRSIGCRSPTQTRCGADGHQHADYEWH